MIHTYVETESKNPLVMQEMQDKHKVPTGGGPTRISRCSRRGDSRCWRRSLPAGRDALNTRGRPPESSLIASHPSLLLARIAHQRSVRMDPRGLFEWLEFLGWLEFDDRLRRAISERREASAFRLPGRGLF